MTERFDAIRAANPELCINLYAMTPGGDVTLEVIAPDGFTATFPAPTAEEALALAFPGPPICPNTGLPCVPGCTRKTCAGLHVSLNEWPDATDDAPLFQATAPAEPTPEPTGSIFD